ncbi:ATP-binding cassette sub-family G member 1-like [Daphnia pulicaria]|uniref:ATP-binding cassette sub-family G member 1-like n=1 Tax=Daphnia pulicaria TaxID=35523 RepID=UPI001EEBC026|nr:ATP-binding cassette sub-family G member 1-like [Daphnia pulicaria]
MEFEMQVESSDLKTEAKIHDDESLDLTFRDLSFTTGKGKNAKRILNQMSGAFKSGQLTVILGPSGAGKSSLMNILAGLKTSGVEGQVYVNGVDRELKSFRKHSVYISQQDHLLTNLTVDEYMVSAAHLKLGNRVPINDKLLMIEHVMKTLGLTESRRTQIGCLSGGECKRLSIGLELLDNPDILFLDEPTSGLDSSASLQCVGLLREIARSGRTVVATIHQPSSRLLDYFDHLYIVACGSCIYQGPIGSLVPYLQRANLNCPSYHNPADFVMDVACGEYGDVLPRLVSGIENGRLIYQENSASAMAMQSPAPVVESQMDDTKDVTVTLMGGGGSRKKEKPTYSAPFHTQVAVLLERTWRIIWRDKMLTKVRFFTHVFLGLLVGTMYWLGGNDAAVILNNASMLFFNLLVILFASTMPTVVTFPLERKVLVREHLNHWYSLKAYYIAKTIADIPFQVLFPGIYVSIVYLMSSQPMSADRFAMLMGITISLALCGQGIGLLLGACFDIQVAVFLAPTGCIPFVLFAGFLVNLNSVPYYMSWMTYFSFMRYAFEGSMLSIYSFDRPLLACSKMYCHLRYPHKLLEQFDMAESSYFLSVVGMLTFFLVVRVIGYFALSFKLKYMR